MRSVESPIRVAATPSLAEVTVDSPIAAHAAQQRKIGKRMVDVNAAVAGIDDLLNEAPDTASQGSDSANARPDNEAVSRLDAMDKRLDSVAAALKSRKQEPMQLELFGVNQVDKGDYSKAKVTFRHYNDADTQGAVPVEAGLGQIFGRGKRSESARSSSELAPARGEDTPDTSSSAAEVERQPRSWPPAPAHGDRYPASSPRRPGDRNTGSAIPTPNGRPVPLPPHHGRSLESDVPSHERKQSNYNLVVASGVEQSGEGGTHFTINAGDVFGAFVGSSVESPVSIHNSTSRIIDNMKRISDQKRSNRVILSRELKSSREAMERTGMVGFALKPVDMGEGTDMAYARTYPGQQNVNLFYRRPGQDNFVELTDPEGSVPINAGARFVICSEEDLRAAAGESPTEQLNKLLQRAKDNGKRTGVVVIDAESKDDKDDDAWAARLGGDDSPAVATQQPQSRKQPANGEQTPTQERKKRGLRRKLLLGAVGVAVTAGTILGVIHALDDDGKPGNQETVQIADTAHDGIATVNEMQPIFEGRANFPANIVERETVVDENQPNKYWTDLNDMVDKAIAGGQLEKIQQDNGTWYLRYTGPLSENMDEYERTKNETVMTALAAQDGATVKLGSVSKS